MPTKVLQKFGDAVGPIVTRNARDKAMAIATRNAHRPAQTRRPVP
jgi:hypothetical protein